MSGTRDYVVLWQRRLLAPMDDLLASSLHDHLGLRVGSLEHGERVLGQALVPLPGPPVFLSLEQDEFDTPNLRLVGDPRFGEALHGTMGEIDAVLDRIEEAAAQPQSSTGLPLWLPYTDAGGSDVMQLVRRTSRIVGDGEAHWPAGFGVPDGRRGRVAGIGILTSDLDTSLVTVREAGGEVLAPVIDRPTGRYGLVADLVGRQLVLWEPDPERPARAVQAFPSLVSPDMFEEAVFYGAIAGWSTQVIRGGPPMTALLTHAGSPIGVLVEASTSADEQEEGVAIASRISGEIVRTAQAKGHAVTVRSVAPLSGRVWSIVGPQGRRLDLVSLPGRRHMRPPRSWDALPLGDSAALRDLQAALFAIEEVLRSILPTSDEAGTRHSTTLIGALLGDDVLPVTERLLDRFRRSSQPVILLEAASALRTTAQGIYDDLQLAVRAIGDPVVLVAYDRSRADLIALGVIEDAPGPLGVSRARV